MNKNCHTREDRANRPAGLVRPVCLSKQAQFAVFGNKANNLRMWNVRLPHCPTKK